MKYATTHIASEAQAQRIKSQDFKAIGEVPSENDTEVWKAYQVAVERFYDLLKMNKELRDYDFKKNLEQKQALCAEAEALDEETVNNVVKVKTKAIRDFIEAQKIEAKNRGEEFIVLRASDLPLPDPLSGYLPMYTSHFLL